MAHVKGPNGDVLEFKDDIAARLAKSDGIEIVNADGSPIAAGDAETDAETDGDGDAQKPGKNSSKADWAAYAAQLGIETTDLTKDQLVAAVAALESANE